MIIINKRELVPQIRLKRNTDTTFDLKKKGLFMLYMHFYSDVLIEVILMLYLVLNNETEFYDDVHNPDYMFNTLQIKGWHISPEEQVKI